MIQLQSIKDFGANEHALMRKLRTFHDVLLLDADAPIPAYQQVLNDLHKWGILNLNSWTEREVIYIKKIQFMYYLHAYTYLPGYTCCVIDRRATIAVWQRNCVK